MNRIKLVTKSQVFSIVTFISAIIFLVALVYVSTDEKDIKVESYQNFRTYAEEGKSFDFIFDVTKEPNEKIMDGVLKYSATLDNLLIKQNSIVSVGKRFDDQGKEVIVTRTFFPNGDVNFDVKIYDNQKLEQQIHRKGKLNKSVFLETSTARIKL
ncbi:hypothetical protein LO80_02040 [Candidatus Francisella endociliophora]|uniref:Uncharacterized protein n=1 Tax=Candidatus Francisella endociliophora TaxID=653937 RepID=A0A097EMT0_9GAMM|nr:hypothetical protein [Francisella sp. FSC1006]AIT08879.1 hypothetical protein LO80_02040 [Francisella sp. FSC1006]